MSETVWIRHPETGGEAEVPSAALPMYRQSGWDTIPKKDLDDRSAAVTEEVAKAEEEMVKKARQALDQTAPEPPADEASTQGAALTEPGVSLADPPKSDATGRRTKKENA